MFVNIVLRLVKRFRFLFGFIVRTNLIENVIGKFCQPTDAILVGRIINYLFFRIPNADCSILQNWSNILNGNHTFKSFILTGKNTHVSLASSYTMSSHGSPLIILHGFWSILYAGINSKLEQFASGASEAQHKRTQNSPGSQSLLARSTFTSNFSFATKPQSEMKKMSKNFILLSVALINSHMKREFLTEWAEIFYLKLLLRKCSPLMSHFFMFANKNKDVFAIFLLKSEVYQKKFCF